MLAAQDARDVAVVERTAAQREPALLEPLGDPACAKRTVAVADRRQPEHRPHDFGLVLADEQLLLFLVAATLHRTAFIAERHRTAVEEPFHGIGAHGPLGVLGRLQREVLVEHGEHVAHEVAARVVAERLRQRYKPHPGALETCEGTHLKLEITREPRERDDLDFSDAVDGILDISEHAIELGPGLLTARHARFAEHRDKVLALRLGIGPDHLDLAVDAGAMLGLILGRHPDIADDLLRGLLHAFTSLSPGHRTRIVEERRKRSTEGRQQHFRLTGRDAEIIWKVADHDTRGFRNIGPGSMACKCGIPFHAGRDGPIRTGELGNPKRAAVMA
nr:hypothetical protein [Sphingomonas sp. CL5.1]